jgi:hypothetical protein
MGKENPRLGRISDAIKDGSVSVRSGPIIFEIESDWTDS